VREAKITQLTATNVVFCSATDGAEYVAQGNGAPAQHIRRQRNGQRWRKPRSKFQLVTNNANYWPDGFALAYWSPFDLLGLFFSKMGPAPNFGTASEANFYLPLTAVYGRFCMWIGLNKRPALVSDTPTTARNGIGAGDPPSYFQCTWDRKSGRFFLGATLAGYSWGYQETGNWKQVVRGWRWGLLEGFHEFPGEYSNWEESPVTDEGLRDTLFGNCAETYPYLEMLG
jgi:hypothetical protein